MASFHYKTLDQLQKIQERGLIRKDSVGDNFEGNAIWNLAFSPDEKFVLCAARKSTLYVIPWDKWKCNLASLRTVDLSDGVLNPDIIVIDTVLRIHSVAFGSCIPGNSNKSTFGRFFRTTVDKVPKDIILATGHEKGRIKIWNVYSGKLILELQDHTEIVKDLAFSRDGTLRLVSGSLDKTLKVWDMLDDGNMTKTLKEHKGAILACVWSPNSRLLASVGQYKEAFVWNMDTYTLHKRLSGHFHEVTSCQFSPDGALLATSSLDTRVILWDPFTGELLRCFFHIYPPPHLIFVSGLNNAWVKGVDFSPDGSHIATICDDHCVRYWGIEGHEPESAALLEDVLVSICFSPSGGHLAVGTRRGEVHFYDNPRAVPRLLHLSRMAIRKRISPENVMSLGLPKLLVSFLQYKEVKDIE